ncbi:recombinase family protein [uncultured Sphingomonas sp.]|uniref:recombinase family protein n=1 Tax=uncultured Sphingomonas sp. TaxID=158754 RepID=UPI0035CB55E2
MSAAVHSRSVRCAIYTRKSSEEGLEQGFNSLDAQYEACAAYILSQASEGWTRLPDRYDDGGLSGGTLERPALQRLLADLAAGRVDIIVVYKVDRLTRSLLDFAKLVEAFDRDPCQRQEPALPLLCLAAAAPCPRHDRMRIPAREIETAVIEQMQPCSTIRSSSWRRHGWPCPSTSTSRPPRAPRRSPASSSSGTGP